MPPVKASSRPRRLRKYLSAMTNGCMTMEREVQVRERSGRGGGRVSERRERGAAEE
jgi:hypothetical protein